MCCGVVGWWLTVTTPSFLGRPRPLEPAHVLPRDGVVSRACRLFWDGTGSGVCVAARYRTPCEVLRSGSGQEWAPPRAHTLAQAPCARTSRISVKHGWVLCHDGAQLQCHTAAVMHEERALRCGLVWQKRGRLSAWHRCRRCRTKLLCCGASSRAPAARRGSIP